VVRLTPEGRAARDAIVAYRKARIVELVAPFEGNEVLRGGLGRIAETFAGSR
jgi:hypothetical protein